MNQTEKILFEQLKKHATHYIESSKHGIVVDDLDVDSFISETSKLVTANGAEKSASTCNLQSVSKSACNNFFSDPFIDEYKCLNCGKMKSEH